MSETRWTPGPWMVDKRAFTRVQTMSGRGIASCGGYSTNTDNGEHLDENVMPSFAPPRPTSTPR